MKAFSLALLSLASLALAQTPLAPNAPKDKEVSITEKSQAAFDKAIAPYVAKARASYPDARKRYLAGLPAKHLFFIVIKLRDKAGSTEQVFVEVRGIADGKVTGIIANEVKLATDFKIGDRHTFPETELVDWLIAKPDGSEEGNVVGHFLDIYKP